MIGCLCGEVSANRCSLLGFARPPCSRLCGALWMAVGVALARPEVLRHTRWGGRGDESAPRRQLPVFIRDLEDQWLTKTPYLGM